LRRRKSHEDPDAQHAGIAPIDGLVHVDRIGIVVDTTLRESGKVPQELGNHRRSRRGANVGAVNAPNQRETAVRLQQLQVRDAMHTFPSGEAQPKL